MKRKRPYVSKYLFKEKAFGVFSIMLFTLLCNTKSFGQPWSPWTTKVIPVYVYDYEGHSGYTDEAIATLICQLNNNFIETNYCVAPTGGKVAGFKFALQTIKRYPGVYTLTSTPNVFIRAVEPTTPEPWYGLHIYLYDFHGGTASGAWIGVAEPSYKNCIFIKSTGFNDKTITHETGHFLGLDHIGGAFGGTLEHAVSTCSYSNDVGPSFSSNYMITSTTPACCYFSANQIETMHCYWFDYLRQPASTSVFWISTYSGMINNSLLMPPTLVNLGFLNNSLQVKVVEPPYSISCPNYYDYMTYSIDYCGDGSGGSHSSDDVWDEPYSPSTIISLYACSGGIVTIKKFFGSDVAVTSYKFSPKAGCSPSEPYASCEITVPGEYYSRTADILPLPEEKLDIQIYPTIATNSLAVKGANEGFQYSIYDMTGKIVKSAKYSPVVNISDLTNGMYLIRFTDDRNVVVKRFSKSN